MSPDSSQRNGPLLTGNLIGQSFLLALASTFSLAALQPRIGIRGLDASAYILASHSLQQGQGYRVPNGDPITYWPPTYSWLLSLFPDPLDAAWVINLLTFGGSVAILCYLAQRCGWHGPAALGWSLAMGSGFFREMATVTRPDMLVYAGFLLGVAFTQSLHPRWRLAGYWIWNFLIPLKLVAAIFTPAALLNEWILRRRKGLLPEKHLVSILGGWLAVVGAIALFNYWDSNRIVPHILNIPQIVLADVPTVSVPEARLLYFLLSVPRSLISHWYGSIRQPLAFALFFGLLLIGISCLATLRPDPEGRRFRNLALTILGMILLLRLVWYFKVGTRIAGYGWLLMILAFRPQAANQKRWLLYAGTFAGFSILNMLTTNALGANDPRYQRLAQEATARGLPAGGVFTNSFRILDLHAQYPTWDVKETSHLQEGAYFLQVTLPAYDPVSSTVWPVSLDSHWQEIYSVPGATLFQKTTRDQTGTKEGLDVERGKRYPST